ncbi:MAG: hypothetical protein K6T78_10200 [Alicyclobacillus sp.]|nr:hypothetical protein [Alicyclobacillus sp.]
MTRAQHALADPLRQVNRLAREAKAQGWDILGLDVGRHLNPGDIFDAYEALGLTPVVSDDCASANACGPLLAWFRHQFPDAPTEQWTAQVAAMFDGLYLAGFIDGFRLVVPERVTEQNLPYIRGVYDGVMAHAAVF